MKKLKSYFISLLASIHLLTASTALAAPAPLAAAAAVAAAGPLIEYHTLPTTTTATTSMRGSDDTVGATIRSLVFGLGQKGAAAPVNGDEDEDDWANWHRQWKRQQEERRCNLWDVCVKVYKPGE